MSSRIPRAALLPDLRRRPARPGTNHARADGAPPMRTSTRAASAGSASPARSGTCPRPGSRRRGRRRRLIEIPAEGGLPWVTRGAGGEPTAFVATAGSGEPVIGLLAEYDALPGLSQAAGQAKKQAVSDGAPGHGCGHNLLGTASVARGDRRQPRADRAQAAGDDSSCSAPRPRRSCRQDVHDPLVARSITPA